MTSYDFTGLQQVKVMLLNNSLKIVKAIDNSYKIFMVAGG